jgi:predicted Holliday junction resolvase-like endonuclease
MLKRVDPVFCGSGLDPQDVKVIFDPVEYVVFDGLSGERLRRILLMGEPPASKKQEKVHRSLASAVRKGNMEFLTLRVTKEGTVERGS